MNVMGDDDIKQMQAAVTDALSHIAAQQDRGD